MVRYFLASLDLFGGDIASQTHTVLSVGADEPPRDLLQEFPWIKQWSVDIRWVDRELFKQWEYDATGVDRFWVESNAEIVAMVDADLLVGASLDSMVARVAESERVHGFMAHISPFGYGNFRSTPSATWWNQIYAAAGMDAPDLDRQVSAWGLDQDFNPNIALADPEHRMAPDYFNYGVIIGPRRHFESMAVTYLDDIETVSTVVPGSRYISQIANCITFARHQIPCDLLPINDNFPLNLPAEEMRRLNPDPYGQDSDEDIRIFHYIGRRKVFASPVSVAEFVGRSDVSAVDRVFQERLRATAIQTGELHAD